MAENEKKPEKAPEKAPITAIVEITHGRYFYGDGRDVKMGEAVEVTISEAQKLVTLGVARHAK